MLWTENYENRLMFTELLKRVLGFET